MDIIQLVLFSIVVTILYLSVKDLQPNIAFLIVLIGGVIVLIQVIQQIKMIVIFIQQLGGKASVEPYYLNTIFKIIGIAYITEIGANITKDAGLSSLGSKIELAGKIFILILALPIIQAVINMILEFIPTSGSM